MSKTVDELAWTYLTAFAEEGGHDICAISKLDERARAGIAAVVRALRDEFGRIMYPGDDWNRQGILEQFDQILGDAGNEKVAEYIRKDTRVVTDPGTAYCAPATDPAPAVCVWTKGFDAHENRKWMRGACGWSFYGTPPFVNCKCGKPIKFTEAQR